MRERINEGELGDLFQISTRRIGPFPNRIKDVGVVKDLATHDLDLSTWVGVQTSCTYLLKPLTKQGDLMKIL
ncbi:MAG: hypothetical protein CM15mP49_26210 [Actinomycetota bacterium]|nr:MAG: hypothetical protein CM15mP49_26210 [Actinomycetota bacterium]